MNEGRTAQNNRFVIAPHDLRMHGTKGQFMHHTAAFFDSVAGGVPVRCTEYLDDGCCIMNFATHAHHSANARPVVMDSSESVQRGLVGNHWIGR